MLRHWLAALMPVLVLAFAVALAQETAEEAAEGLAAGEPLVLPVATDARLSATSDRARLIVDLSGVTEFAFVSLTEPDRIAVDVRVEEMPDTPPPTLRDSSLVSGFTTRQIAADRGRVTLDLTGPAQVQQAYVLEPFEDQPARLIVDLIPDTPDAFTARAEADRAASLAAQDGAPPADGEPETTAELEAQSTPPGDSLIVTDTRPLILLDPGHGGVDNGATAPNGIREKEIVLDFALRLRDLLVASGRFDVALTREDDRYVRLDERVAIARRNRANLFISIHADSFEMADVRGASVYTRDERATDVLDRVLAEQENAADLVAGLAPPDAEPQVVSILVDLMRREVRRQAYVAAESLVRHLEPSVRMRPFPLRQADFFVLQAPDVPSLLVELGFMSNASDVENLANEAWRDRVAEALARGIAAYFDGLP